MHRSQIGKKKLLVLLILVTSVLGFIFRYLLLYAVVTNPPFHGILTDEVGVIPKEYWKHINPLRFRFMISKSSTAGDYDIKAYDHDSVIFAGSHGPWILYDDVDTNSFTTFHPSGYGYAKDKNYVYFSYGWTESPGPSSVTIVEGADPKTFTVIGDDTEARDANSKYYKGKKITDEELRRVRELEHLQFEELLMQKRKFEEQDALK